MRACSKGAGLRQGTPRHRFGEKRLEPYMTSFSARNTGKTRKAMSKMPRRVVAGRAQAEGRQFPFNALPELRALLEQQRAATAAAELKHARKIPHVFHRNGGRPIKDFYTAWDTACWTVGLATKDPTTGKVVHNEHVPHDFRRTAVRNLVRRGVTERVAMQLTGT